jgi:hypothetical protein
MRLRNICFLADFSKNLHSFARFIHGKNHHVAEDKESNEAE